jgi:hypothetical protein
MKHVKLFENFHQVNFQTGSVVVGIVSEGVDVAVFPREKAMNILRKWKMITNKSKNNYYMPFNFNLAPSLSSGDSDLFLVVDVDGSIDIEPIELVENVSLHIMTGFDLDNLAQDTPMSIYYKNGKFENFNGGGASPYAVELVGGDKYMSAQSSGFGEENGAYEYFMNFFDNMD